MATIKRFEELEVWQMARVQCDIVFKMMQEARFAKDRPLEDQINRASGSVMDNISEGFDRYSRAEFKQALVIARGSNAEVRSQLYRAADRRWISKEENDLWLAANAKTGSKIHNLIQYLIQSSFRQKPSTNNSKIKVAGNSPEDMPGNNLSEPQEEYSTLFSYNLPQEFYCNPNN